MTFVPDEGRIPRVHHPSALGPDGRTRLMVHCDRCGVRTYCRLLDGLLYCADRCWPLVVSCDYDLDSICHCPCKGDDPMDTYSICPRHAGKECGACNHREWVERQTKPYPAVAEEYNSRRGDEVRCIHCDRRIMFSQQDNAWIHWDANRLECQPTTYAQPPTNYRP